MRIINYYPGGRGIRFLRSIRKFFRTTFKEIFITFHSHDKFLDILRLRKNKFDIVLITSHGWNDCILKPTKDSYIKVITKDKSHLFVNNFVFAFSCNTANEFGTCCVEEETLTYIGFDDTIGPIFRFEGSKRIGSNKRIKNNLEIIMKGIYISSINKVFNKFINECLSAKEFYQALSLKINGEIAKTLNMTTKEINTRFSTNLKESEKSLVDKIIRIELVAKFEEIGNKMSLKGEENYIPWLSISMQGADKLNKLLEKVRNIDTKYLRYRYFTEAMIYHKLGDRENFRNALDNFRNSMTEFNLSFSEVGKIAN